MEGAAMISATETNGKWENRATAAAALTASINDSVSYISTGTSSSLSGGIGVGWSSSSASLFNDFGNTKLSSPQDDHEYDDLETSEWLRSSQEAFASPTKSPIKRSITTVESFGPRDSRLNHNKSDDLKPAIYLSSSSMRSTSLPNFDDSFGMQTSSFNDHSDNAEFADSSWESNMAMQESLDSALDSALQHSLESTLHSSVNKSKAYSDDENSHINEKASTYIPIEQAQDHYRSLSDTSINRNSNEHTSYCARSQNQVKNITKNTLLALLSNTKDGYIDKDSGDQDGEKDPLLSQLQTSAWPDSDDEASRFNLMAEELTSWPKMSVFHEGRTASSEPDMEVPEMGSDQQPILYSRDAHRRRPLDSLNTGVANSMAWSNDPKIVPVGDFLGKRLEFENLSDFENHHKLGRQPKTARSRCRVPTSTFNDMYQGKVRLFGNDNDESQQNRGTDGRMRTKRTKRQYAPTQAENDLFNALQNVGFASHNLPLNTRFMPSSYTARPQALRKSRSKCRFIPTSRKRGVVASEQQEMHFAAVTSAEAAANAGDGGVIRRELPPGYERREKEFPKLYIIPRRIEHPYKTDGRIHCHVEPGNLYNPRWVRGNGMEKKGLCPLCTEETWNRTKTSGYWYHMNFFHGVSQTGKLYDVPARFAIVPRGPKAKVVGKPERDHIMQGYCTHCRRWVDCQGIKLTEAKVPEIFWWRHIRRCNP